MGPRAAPGQGLSRPAEHVRGERSTFRPELGHTRQRAPRAGIGAEAPGRPRGDRAGPLRALGERGSGGATQALRRPVGDPVSFARNVAGLEFYIQARIYSFLFLKKEKEKTTNLFSSLCLCPRALQA